jgi:hypothetical protein
LFQFTTPDEFPIIHAKAIISAEDEFNLQIWEGATLQTGAGTGIEIPSYNNLRTSSRTGALKAYVLPEVLDSGTKFWEAQTTSSKIGANVQPGFNYEIITNTGTTYLWKITKVAAGTHWLDYDFFWTEHDD